MSVVVLAGSPGERRRVPSRPGRGTQGEVLGDYQVESEKNGGSDGGCGQKRYALAGTRKYRVNRPYLKDELTHVFNEAEEEDALHHPSHWDVTEARIANRFSSVRKC